MYAVTSLDCSRIAQDLQIRKVQVEAVVQLLDEDNTVPFITRYRKERTGGLNEDAIRHIQTRINFLRQLGERKQTILKSIEHQGKLTDELRQAIVGAETTRKLEDLYLPYKPKKRSLATTARERGLEPLALALWYSDPAASNLEELLPSLVNPDKELKTPDEVRLGVQHILAEMIAETADIRATARHVLWETGEVGAAKNEKLGEGQGQEYKGYFQFKEAARQIPPHRILALNRGEKEGVLKIKLAWHTERLDYVVQHALADHLLQIAGRMPPPPAPPLATDPIPIMESAPAERPSGESLPAAPAAAEEIAAAPAETMAPVTSDVALAATGEIPSVAHFHHDAAVVPAAAEAAPAVQPLVASLTVSEPRPPLEGERLAPDAEFRSPHAKFLLQALEDSMQRLLLPSLEREIRGELTDEAETHAVSVFARNLRSLLLQPPLRGKRVLAIDPGFRTGCKVAVLDDYGNLLEHTVIYPFGGGGKKGKKSQEPRAQEGETKEPDQAAEAAPATEDDSARTEMPQSASAEVEGAAPAQAPPTPQPTQPEVPQPEAPPEIQPPEQPPAPAPSPDPTAPPGPAPVAPPPMQVPPAPPGPHAQQTAPGPDRKLEAKARLQDLLTKHATEVIALGNGTGCRETEELIADLIGAELPQLAYVIVNEAGASVYSVSQVAKDEFPDYDATTRSAISIGRRLQDPLSELVKIDPQSIGVGLYQHDVGRKELKETLEAVVESCVNQVGVDVNTASVPLLRYVSGMNQMVAREVAEYRKQHGALTSREQLLEVQGLGPARYTQAAGFLKLPSAGNPFDRTWIHPESYGAAQTILGELGYGPAVVDDKAAHEEFHAKLRGASAEELAKKVGAGTPTVQDILQALLKPGRDPREDLPPPIFKKGILKIDDLQAGMELKGTVLNVVDFGAFVDVGLKDSGLVHISQMANRYIKSPYDVVAVNDVVTVWVLAVDKDRHHVSLTMIEPGTERKPEKREPQPRQGNRPPRGRRPPPQNQGQPTGAAQGPGPNQHAEGGRGRPPRGRAPVGARPAPVGAEASAAPPSRPALPPRKPRRDPPRAKLTQDAIEGKVPLRTFSELSALFATKKKEPEPAPRPAPETPVDMPAAGEPSVESTPPV
jgi:protein Tex